MVGTALNMQSEEAIARYGAPDIFDTGQGARRLWETDSHRP